jgi:uncharacterized phiE125 gp8 family phage protein
MGVRIVTQPTVEPVTLAEVKQDLRIEHTDYDTMLARHITAARSWLERRIQRKIAEQELEFTFDEFPAAEIKLPVGPAIAVTEITYDDEGGFEQTVDSATYWLDNVSEDSWIFPEESWPVTLDAVNSVRVYYTAGYDDLANVPAELKQAIRLKVQELYEGGDYEKAITDLITNSLRIYA